MTKFFNLSLFSMLFLVSCTSTNSRDSFAKAEERLAREYLNSQNIDKSTLDFVVNNGHHHWGQNNFYAQDRVFMIIWELPAPENHVLKVFLKPKDKNFAKLIPFKYEIVEKDYLISPLFDF